MSQGNININVIDTVSQKVVNLFPSAFCLLPSAFCYICNRVFSSEFRIKFGKHL